MIFTLIIAIVFWIVVSGHNQRIKALEEKLSDKKTPVERSSAPIYPEQLMQSHPLQQSQTSTAPKMSPKKEDTSSHEEDSGRLLGKMGIAAVFLAVAFFIKYAFDNNWVTETGRIVVGLLIGFILIGIGQYLRKKYLRFGETLAGGGVAILYLSIFAAHSYYNLTTTFATAIFLLLTTAVAFVIAIANKDMTLSVLAVVGGFITPFLVGSDTNSMYEIFGYVTLLNLFVLGLSHAKKWPQLGLLALAGTIVNFIVWSINYYDATFLTPTMMFLGLTFLIFLVASVRRITITKEKIIDEEYVLMSGSVLFFALSSYLILYPNHQSLAALVSLLVGIIFGTIAIEAHKLRPNDQMINGFMSVMAILFITLAVPLQFSGITIAILWLVEALALSFLSSSFKNSGLQSLAVGVYGLALINFFVWNSGMGNIAGFTPIANKAFLVAMIAVAVAYTIAHLYKNNGSNAETKKEGMVAFIVIANILTLYAFSTQIIFYHQDKMMTAMKEKSMQVGQYNNNASYQTYVQNSQAVGGKVASIKNRSHTYVSILWAIYAAVLTAIGFAKRVSYLRRIGLFFFVITAIKVFIDVWSLGQLYRIISFIVFGVIALVASFAYAKYKDRLKDTI